MRLVHMHDFFGFETNCFDKW